MDTCVKALADINREKNSPLGEKGALGAPEGRSMERSEQL
jgi:hypothetical protein